VAAYSLATQVMSHFPLYHTGMTKNPGASAKRYIGDESEQYATDGHEFLPCETPGCRTVEMFRQDLISALEPLLIKYGVDIYNGRCESVSIMHCSAAWCSCCAGAARRKSSWARARL
jgi:hypothetical protein